MDNLTQHFSHQPTLLVFFIISFVLLFFSIPYFIQQNKRYGSPFDFASQARKSIAAISAAILIGTIVYSLSPYVTPPSNEIAIVLGNTKNSPMPKISPEITDTIVGTLMQHKGGDKYEIADSIKLISATKKPTVINLDPSELELREIGQNNSNAKRSAEIDVKAIEGKIQKLIPSDNGANYLEAILAARDNVKKGSNIIVIGSGLSDEGDLNFSKSNILTNEQSRSETINEVQKKYGYEYLQDYNVEFYGLGDTVKPQEALSSKQKDIIRDIYKEVIQGLGGNVNINTKTLVGDSVKTNYVVGTTDTGCGDIGLVYDDDNLKFVGNEAEFIDPAKAKESLMTIKNLWDKYSDNIQQIKIEGYIAHYPGHDNLSKQRADQVKNVLVSSGVPVSKIDTEGRGYGPYEKDSQNRMVKITIKRSDDQCR